MEYTIAHQSQESWTPSAAVSLWRVLSDEPESLGSNKFYNVGSIVSYQGRTYQCTIAHQSKDSRTPGTSVPLWKKSHSLTNTWDPQNFYNLNEVVIYQGQTYKCAIAHQSRQSSSRCWGAIMDKIRVIPCDGLGSLKVV